jgi:hypothetical protein
LIVLQVYVDAAARDKEKKLEEYNEAHPPTRNGLAELGPSEEAVPSPPVLTQEMPEDQEHKKKKKKDKKRKSDAGDGSHHHKRYCRSSLTLSHFVQQFKKRISKLDLAILSFRRIEDSL